jgi:cell division protein FtsI (penicillin-binding protein 3)
MSGARRQAPKGRWDAAERLPGRRRLLLVSMGLAAIAIVGRGVQLQAFEVERLRAAAAAQHEAKVSVPARRGGIFDRDGVPLALTRETFRVSVAPAEVRDRPLVMRRLREVLELSPAAARRATDPARRWTVLPGRFSAEQYRALQGVRGLHFERALERFYPQGRVGREILGGVSGDGRALGGVEQEMDALLRGTDGESVMRRDARGQVEPSINLPVVPPRDGHDVYLTIDFDLQEIADEALSDAIERTQASGGDLLLADPRTGELLAAVSRRKGGVQGLGAFIEPYEPGSTLKPFFVAGLLAGRHATLNDRVHAENGTWTMPNGRVLRDVHPYEWLTLRDALRVSSNIGMAKLADRLPPGEQYRVLRDYGFGTPTGIEYPVEAAGRLTRPASWTDYTPASLAMGYEVAVTPLQLTMAYGALANGGALMQPRLVREVRGPEGETVRTVSPRALRRPVPKAVSDDIRDVLVSVVDDGTGSRAALSTFTVAGKTGTARRTGAGGRYDGSYNSTFAGFFPAQDPQLAIYVKLDQPKGDYYGGLTAAPVTREALQAILAARTRALDGAGLLATRLPLPATPVAPSVAGGDSGAKAIPARPAAESVPRPPSGAEGSYVFEQPAAPAARPVSRAAGVPVPEVAGLPLRDAARRLHALGFRVRLRGAGTAEATSPAAGALVARGDTVVVVGRDR